MTSIKAMIDRDIESRGKDLPTLAQEVSRGLPACSGHRGRSVITAVVISLLCIVGVIGQKTTLPPGVESVELQSPFVHDANGKVVQVLSPGSRTCLNLVTLKLGCIGVTVDFGTRIGVNRDLFKINGSRTRIVRVGRYAWTDKFTVPFVEPWPPLAPGEQRHISVNASGTEVAKSDAGRPSSPGIVAMNGDGTYTPIAAQRKSKGKTYATADVTEQVSSKVVGKDGKIRNDGYTPLMAVMKDQMYAVHVVDADRDFYVLIRVDDVVTGDRIKISFFKLDVTEAL